MVCCDPVHSYAWYSSPRMGCTGSRATKEPESTGEQDFWSFSDASGPPLCLANDSKGGEADSHDHDHDPDELETLDADAHVLRGDEFWQIARDTAAAEHEYRQALRVDPSNARAHNHLGALLNDVRKDRAGAERAFRLAIAAAPTYASAHANLGALLYIIRGDARGAEQALSDAVRYDPHHARAHRNLGMLLGQVVVVEWNRMSDARAR